MGLAPFTNSKKFLNDPPDTSYWFCPDTEGVQSYAGQSYEYLWKICDLEPGTTLYIPRGHRLSFPILPASIGEPPACMAGGFSMPGFESLFKIKL